ncbi:lipopolysaccharide biosynthesis protein [Pseudosporangium ferrugineum]|uniref:O-antigen/teichoic acid export membrane protein n=1 Tax=Pseudosporangium ferrugineum TaxID=439699 RepID=A0A2T0RIX4_9ACTN|nr:lipopolysaccharide biosynthesis protein [Pseudosporangium ferrugineum]PRY21050.1 O-antigen/teichoic acid export membrane protein [Pseudosporangium ferrugineum]
METAEAVPESLDAGPEGPGRSGLVAVLRGHLDLFLNAGSLMATTAITSLFGFAYWWLAARTAPAEAVGQASAAVSAMTLIGTIGMFGMGTMLISDLPALKGRRWELISTCLLVAGSAATVGGLIYVALAHFAAPGLRDALGSTAATVLLVFGIALNAMTLVLDEALVGLLQGPLQLMRNAWFSVIKLALLGVLALLPLTLTGSDLLLTWVAGMVASVAVLGRALRRRGMVDSVRPRASLLRGRGRATFDHNLLNLATYLPRAALPLVVTAVLSAEANASFYTAFMVLSFLAMVPGNVALTLFAVASGDRAALRSKVRMGLLICLGGGLPVSLVVAFAAEPIMSIFGASYAASAGTALTILALTYVPFVFHHFFLAISRVQGTVRGAGVFSVFAGIAELIAAWYGGTRGDLTELVTWVALVMAAETVLVAPTVLRVVFARDARATPEGENIVSSTGLTLRERAWLPLEYIRTVGPLTGVTAERLRAALIGLHAADPAHRAVSRLDRSGARWLHLDADAFATYVREAVTDLGDGPADFDAMTRRLQAEPRGHHPVRILAGGGYVAMKVAHAYGDAGPVNTLLRELVRAAAEDRPAAIAPSVRHRWALPKAWWKQFGTKPGRWKQGLSFARPPHPEQGPTRAWTAALTVETARSADVLAKMRVWRDEHAPGVTTSAITFAAFTAALRDLGLNPDLAGGTFLADARRYVGKDVSIDSNFCMGPYLSPPSLTDPKAIHTTLKAELATGRILTMMLLREGKLLVAGSPGLPDPYPGEAPVEPRPRLTFSNQGRHDVLADLPWAGEPAVRVNQSVPTLNGPEGITLTTSEMGGVLHLEATFHASTFDPAVVARALELVCTDPAALIMAAR